MSDKQFFTIVFIIIGFGGWYANQKPHEDLTFNPKDLKEVAIEITKIRKRLLKDEKKTDQIGVNQINIAKAFNSVSNDTKGMKRTIDAMIPKINGITANILKVIKKAPKSLKVTPIKKLKISPHDH